VTDPTRNVDPAQTWPLSTNPGPDDQGATVQVREPSTLRMPFGGKERGGAKGGELHPDGLGPAPADYAGAPDIAGLPWARAMTDAWSSLEVRTAVLALVRRFYANHRGSARRLIGWDVLERATSEQATERLPPGRQYLRLGFTYRLGENRSARFECSQTFPVSARTGAGLAQAIESWRLALEQQASVLG
jgi:hypothetical protein